MNGKRIAVKTARCDSSMPFTVHRSPLTVSGFSLIELIVVMVVVGILAGIVAVFIRSPMEGYMAASRRAELSDTADGALHRIARDVRTALPNSVRITQNEGITYLEFLPIQDGGRYREAQRSTPTCASTPDDNDTPGCNILDFTQSDTTFDVLGPAVTVAIGQSVVIYNLGIEGADVWAGDNLSVVEIASSTGCAGSGSACTLVFGSFKFPFEPPGNRFYLVGAPVSYICNPANGELWRITGYDLQATQPKQTSDFGTVDPRPVPRLLANHVTTCSFTYDPGASQRLGQLTLRIQLSQDGETVTLYREVMVNNDA